MLGTLARSMVLGAVRKRVGVPEVGPVSGALLTTGAALLIARGPRRPIGAALLAAGGLLLWREIERERADAAPVSGDEPEPVAEVIPAKLAS